MACVPWLLKPGESENPKLEKRNSKLEKAPPPVFVDVLHTNELRAGSLDLLFLRELRADDFGQKRAKRGDGLDLRKGKELA